MVNKKGQRTMKTAIKYFWPFGRLELEVKIGPKFSTKDNKVLKKSKLSKYINDKSWSSLLYSSMKKIQKDSIDF